MTDDDTPTVINRRRPLPCPVCKAFREVPGPPLLACSTCDGWSVIDDLDLMPCPDCGRDVDCGACGARQGDLLA